MFPTYTEGKNKGERWSAQKANARHAEIVQEAREFYRKRERDTGVGFDGNEIRRYVTREWRKLCGQPFDDKAFCAQRQIVYRKDNEGPALPRLVGPSVGMGAALPNPGERQTLNAPGPSVAGVNASQRTPGSIDDGE